MTSDEPTLNKRMRPRNQRGLMRKARYSIAQRCNYKLVYPTHRTDTLPDDFDQLWLFRQRNSFAEISKHVRYRNYAAQPKHVFFINYFPASTGFDFSSGATHFNLSLLGMPLCPPLLGFLMNLKRFE